ncbi:MAG: hypothetical protein KDA44_16375 [Planctomycetales bacterium]|nr:hypothetical protein [Planctomycetales bacterium]
MKVQPETNASVELDAAAFDDASSAVACVSDLLAAGIDSGDVTVFCADEEVRRRFPELHAQSGGPAEKGGILGALFGGTLGAVIAGGGLATAGGLPIVLAGGLASALAGGVAGGFAGAMTQRGLSTDAADFYDSAVQQGKILVSVSMPDHDPQSHQRRFRQVRKIFAKHDGDSV